MRNIAITGRMAAGKSTISNILEHDYGFTRASFAARLKEVAADVYNVGRPIQKGEVYRVTDENDGDEYELTGRELLQQLGQVVKGLDRDFWIRWMLSDVERVSERSPGTYFVLDDLRFPYEAKALRQRGWLIVKVETPLGVRLDRYQKLYGRTPTSYELNHPSETGVDLIVPDVAVDGRGDPYTVADMLVERVAAA